MEYRFGNHKEVGKYFYMYKNVEGIKPYQLRDEWEDWCLYNFNREPYSIDKERLYGNFLLKFSDRNMETAIEYLQYLREKELLFTKETWNEFINNR